MFLYLTTNGLTLSKSGGRFVLYHPEAKEEHEQQIPISLVEGIVIFGKIQLTTDVIRACLKGKIPVFFLSKKGNYFGKLDSLEMRNVELLYRHIWSSLDPLHALNYAKAFIKAKIHNSRIMLQRRTRLLFPHINTSDIQKTLGGFEKTIESVENIERLRGLEGIASKTYFEGFAKYLVAPFTFTKRTRRPPKDPVNSLLSLGYTLLAQTIHMILDIQGINSQIGFFHQPKDLRPLLVLDIMEMFRAWIVDDLVIKLIKQEKITMDHFIINEHHSKSPVLLTDEGLKIFLQAYYQVIFKEQGSGEIRHENDFIKLKIIEQHIETFKQSLTTSSVSYQGFCIK